MSNNCAVCSQLMQSPIRCVGSQRFVCSLDCYEKESQDYRNSRAIKLPEPYKGMDLSHWVTPAGTIFHTKEEWMEWLDQINPALHVVKPAR